MPNGIRTLSDVLSDLDSIISEIEQRRPCPDSHGHSADYACAESRGREMRMYLASAVDNQPMTLYNASDRQEIAS